MAEGLKRLMDELDQWRRQAYQQVLDEQRLRQQKQGIERYRKEMWMILLAAEVGACAGAMKALDGARTLEVYRFHRRNLYTDMVKVAAVALSAIESMQATQHDEEVAWRDIHG